MREVCPGFLFGADRQAGKRRYIAGNYAYISLTENLEQLPHETTGGALEKCCRKDAVCSKNRDPAEFGFAVIRKYWLYAGKSERSSLKC